jgi:hypothetical protein
MLRTATIKAAVLRVGIYFSDEATRNATTKAIDISLYYTLLKIATLAQRGSPKIKDHTNARIPLMLRGAP